MRQPNPPGFDRPGRQKHRSKTSKEDQGKLGPELKGDEELGQSLTPSDEVGVHKWRRGGGVQPDLTCASGVADDKISVTDQISPSPPAAVALLDIVCPEADAPRTVKRAGVILNV